MMRMVWGELRNESTFTALEATGSFMGTEIVMVGLIFVAQDWQEYMWFLL